MPRGRTGAIVKSSDIDAELECGRIYVGNRITVYKLINLHKKFCSTCAQIKDIKSVQTEPVLSIPKYGKAGSCMRLEEM
jgi:hypothetical protein